MKASLKFREEQKPLVRGKIPLSILGFPFSSGISAGESKELRLDLSTTFESGPSFRLSYRPNDSWNPFSLIVKTGTGALGSPFSAPLSMSAEFNLVGEGSPSFFIHFKPRIGDFGFKRTAGSAGKPLFFGRKVVADHDGNGHGLVDGSEPVNGVFRPENGTSSGKVANGFPTEISPLPAGSVEGLLSGVELTIKSVLPLRNRAALKFQWGVKIPSELRATLMRDGGSRNLAAGMPLRKLPLLVMNKVSIEHVAAEAKDAVKSKADDPATNAGDVAEAWFSVRKQLEAMQAENGILRQAVEELRAEIGGGRLASTVTGGQVTAKNGNGNGKGWDNEGRSAAKSGGKGPEIAGKPSQAEASEELKKALMRGAGAGN